MQRHSDRGLGFPPITRRLAQSLCVLLLMIPAGASLAGVEPQIVSHVVVQGYADIFLAGQPKGTILAWDERGEYDEAPYEGPEVVAVEPGSVITLTAHGGTANRPYCPAAPPDGGNLGWGFITGGSHFALSSIDGFPINSLVGVFIGSASPPQGTPPSPLPGPSYTSSHPLLRQIFFIGDGIGDAAGQGGQLRFTVPAGAKYLCLGSADTGGTNYDNSGVIGVDLGDGHSTPTPTRTPSPTRTPTRRPTATPTPAPVLSVLPYFEPFNSTPGSEWSQSVTEVTPSGGRRFLGRFGANSSAVLLTLDPLGPHTELNLSFDLFIIGTWDGNVSSANGPDIFTLRVLTGPGQPQAEPVRLVNTTFLNQGSFPGESQAYPGSYPSSSNPARTGAVEADALGYKSNGPVCDSVYHISARFAHSAPSMLVEFSATLPDLSMGVANESWGLDNVRVEQCRTAVSERDWALYE